MGVSTIASENRAGAGRGRVRARFARQSHEYRRHTRRHDCRRENFEGRCMRVRAGGSAVWISTAEGGAAPECDPAAGSVHDAARRTRLPYHRVRRIRLLTVSTCRDIFDRCPGTIYDLSISREAPGLIDIRVRLRTTGRTNSTRLVHHAYRKWLLLPASTMIVSF